MRKCVINVANGGWYPEGQKRLTVSLRNMGFGGEIIAWTHDTYPPDSPTQQEVPYAFKIYAFEEAFRRGNDLVFWLDASMWATKPFEAIWKEIQNEGHIIFKNNWTVGQWCTDAALQTLGLDRETALNMPDQLGGIIGLNKHNERSMTFLRQWKDLSKDGITFHGPWNNSELKASSDTRVKGHRHDQTAASVLSTRLGMKWHPLEDSYLQLLQADKEPIKPNSLILCRGM